MIQFYLSPHEKPIEVESLGKRVMKTPNLAEIDQDFRDEDFLVEHGLMKR